MYEFSLCVEGKELSDQFVTGFVVSAGDDDSCPLFSEGKSRGTSDAREGASDQNNGGIHSELLGGQFMGQLRLTVKYVRPYYSCQVISLTWQNRLNSGCRP